MDRPGVKLFVVAFFPLSSIHYLRPARPASLNMLPAEDIGSKIACLFLPVSFENFKDPRSAIPPLKSALPFCAYFFENFLPLISCRKRLPPRLDIGFPLIAIPFPFSRCSSPPRFREK